MSRVTISLDEATYRRLVQHATQRDVPVEFAAQEILSDAMDQRPQPTDLRTKKETFSDAMASAFALADSRNLESEGRFLTRDEANGIDPC
jgi:hypothetical protein